MKLLNHLKVDKGGLGFLPCRLYEGGIKNKGLGQERMPI